MLVQAASCIPGMEFSTRGPAAKSLPRHEEVDESVQMDIEEESQHSHAHEEEDQAANCRPFSDPEKLPVTVDAAYLNLKRKLWGEKAQNKYGEWPCVAFHPIHTYMRTYIHTPGSILLVVSQGCVQNWQNKTHFDMDHTSLCCRKAYMYTRACICILR